MDLFQRQQFDFLLQTAVQRFAERLQERHGSCEAALLVLRDAQAQTEVDEFVSAIFRDFLLDNVDGASFVLRALANKRLGQSITVAGEQSVEAALIQLACKQFRILLAAKTSELIQQHLRYEGVPVV